MSIRFVTLLTTKLYFICHDVSSVNSCQTSEANIHALTPVQVAQTIKKIHSNCGNHKMKKITFYVCIRFAGLLSDAQCSTAFLLIQHLCIVINNLVTRQRNLWGKKRHTQSQLRFNNSNRNILHCIDFLFFLSVTEFVTEYKLLWSQKGSNYSQKYAFKLEVFVIFSAFQSIHTETSSEMFAICIAKEYEYSEYLRIYSNALESMLTKSVRFKSNNKITQCGKNLQKKGSSLWQPSDSCKLNVRTIILHKRTIGESAVMGNDYTIGHCLSHYIQLWSFFLSIQFIDLFASKFVKNHFFLQFWWKL